jgi:WD40 repeat protein
MKVRSNGQYVAAPTFDGNVFIFHMKTGEVSGILRDHQGEHFVTTEVEVRDVIFHPCRKLLLTCADDGVVNIYRQGASEITFNHTI